MANLPCRVKIGLGSSGAVAVSSARGPLARASSSAAAKKNRLQAMTTHFGQVEAWSGGRAKTQAGSLRGADGDRRKTAQSRCQWLSVAPIEALEKVRTPRHWGKARAGGHRGRSGAAAGDDGLAS